MLLKTYQTTFLPRGVWTRGGEAGLEPGEAASPHTSPLRAGMEALFLPSREEEVGKKGQSLPAVVSPNPHLSEAAGK